MTTENDSRFEDSTQLAKFESLSSRAIEPACDSDSAQFARNVYQKENERVSQANAGLPKFDLVDLGMHDKAKNQEQLISAPYGEHVLSKNVPSYLFSPGEVEIPGTGKKVDWPPAGSGAKVDFYLSKESNGSGQLCLQAQSGDKTWLWKKGNFQSYWEEKK